MNWKYDVGLGAGGTEAASDSRRLQEPAHGLGGRFGSSRQGPERHFSDCILVLCKQKRKALDHCAANHEGIVFGGRPPQLGSGGWVIGANPDGFPSGQAPTVNDIFQDGCESKCLTAPLASNRSSCFLRVKSPGLESSTPGFDAVILCSKENGMWWMQCPQEGLAFRMGVGDGHGIYS